MTTSKQKLQQYAKQHGFDPENFSIDQLIENDRRIRAMYSMLLNEYTKQAHEKAKQIAEQQNRKASMIHIDELKSMTIEDLVKKLC